ncbi:hypothetical protein UK23_15480 [Lentzea aerocolonigenes]|uniref:Tail assembly chaperone n=1 Tax=Lentzea aerocolonigenes TaxID=68170 RepID=A0A0F0H279_LENAE|nr:hypothetical protein [Lentzea aerocolonigenes]KJK48956.1 hypothetical protein UK23_15480 [Lentzea aerocolonigenes]
MSTRQRAAATKAKTTRAKTDVTVEWRGETFALPTAEDFPLDALEAEEAGKHLTALRMILGEQQYKAWRALARTAKDAEEFSAVVMGELGAGNR